MSIKIIAFTAFCSLISITAQTAPLTPPIEPDWSIHATISEEGRSNPYGWDEPILSEKIRQGQLHALNYPVQTTGVLVPTRIAKRTLDLRPGDPLFGFIRALLSLSPNFKKFNGFWAWLGLSDYPSTEKDVPFPNGIRPMHPMGVSIIRRHGPLGDAQGYTLSCATCHMSSLFGTPVMGLSNRVTRANDFYHHGISVTSKVKPRLVASLFGLNKAERDLYAKTLHRMKFVGVRSPQALGLDASIAQVALSLSKRGPTEWAERTDFTASHPRPNIMETYIADSKPPVWWNVKYKTHWSADGTLRSGNPILTNILWNEIGRGADFRELMEWVDQNQTTIEELTTAVFANQAPKYRKFFGNHSIHIERARRGEVLFNSACIRCHGQYEKQWEHSPETIKVRYRQSVRVVGTDSNRNRGVRAVVEDLNRLAYSKKYGIFVEEQQGYIPPPLEGIWARYPYFHNNSIPNLCALMTTPESRPTQYYAGAAVLRDRDYSQTCVGYPMGDSLSGPIWKGWKTKTYLFDTTLPGLSNSGHWFGIFTDDEGREIFSLDQKMDLIEYLKTL